MQGKTNKNNGKRGRQMSMLFFFVSFLLFSSFPLLISDSGFPRCALIVRLVKATKPKEQTNKKTTQKETKKRNQSIGAQSAEQTERRAFLLCCNFPGNSIGAQSKQSAERRASRSPLDLTLLSSGEGSEGEKIRESSPQISRARGSGRVGGKRNNQG